MARMAKRLTPNVTIYTDGAKELAQQTLLAAADDDIKVEFRSGDHATGKKGAKESSVVVYLEDGHKITEGVFFGKLCLALQFAAGMWSNNWLRRCMLRGGIRCTSLRAKSTGRLHIS